MSTQLESGENSLHVNFKTDIRTARHLFNGTEGTDQNWQTTDSDEFLRGYTRNIEPRTCEIVNRVLNFV